MKPLHVGLLVIGATMAGALAFQMTRQPVIPDPPPLPRPAAIPTPSAAAPRKPSPLLTQSAAPPQKTPPETAAEIAPAVVYDDPAPKAAPGKPAVRKSKPAIIAAVRVPPTQWVPTKYQNAPAVNPTRNPEPTAQAEPAHVAAPEPPPPAPRRVTLPPGMTVAVRLEESLSSSGATPGDTFQVSLSEPLVVDGLVIAERGARATGRVVDSERGVISLALSSVFTSDGQRVALSTDPWSRQTESTFFIRRPATVPTGTIIHFRLSNRVTVTEQIATR
jgi:hypothetical protein